MPKALDSGKTFLDAVLAKLPENLRDSARTAFAAPEAAEALTLLGDGVLARSDYSKNMDEFKAQQEALAADYEKLNTWYDQNKERLGKVTTLEAEIARLQGNPPPPAPPAKPTEVPVAGLTKEEVAQILEDRDKGYAGVLALTTSLATKHLRDFNEILDVNALIDHATKNKVDLKTAYETVHHDQIAAKAKAEEDARINKEVDARIAERLKGQPLPYPVRGSSPSVLDILESAQDKPSNHTVDTAVAEYDRLQAARG